MPSLIPVGPLKSWLASLMALVGRFVMLAVAEGRQAGLRLLSVLGLVILAAGLAITAWLGLLAGIIVGLVERQLVSLSGALGIVALLSFAGAGAVAWLAMRQTAKPLFVATLRQLGVARNAESGMTEVSPPTGPCEREVQAGRMAVQAEYQVACAGVRRRLASPRLIGGLVLAGMVAGYFVRGRRQADSPRAPRRPGSWTQMLATVQALMPLGMALHSAFRPRAAAVRPAEVAPRAARRGSRGA